MGIVSVGPMEPAQDCHKHVDREFVGLDLSIVRRCQPGGREVPGWSAQALGLSLLNAKKLTGKALKVLLRNSLQVPGENQVLKLCGYRTMEDSARVLRGVGRSLVYDEGLERLFWDGGPEPVITDEERLASLLVWGNVKVKVEVTLTPFPADGGYLAVQILNSCGGLDRSFVLEGITDSTTLLRLKGLIGEEMGVPPSGLLLLCEGKLLIDSIASCRQLGILSGMTLRAVRDNMGCRFSIVVKTLTAKTMTFYVNGGDRVDALKDQICKKEGIPVDQQRLIGQGTQLEDERLLAEYGIEDGAVIHLVLRLRGGMYHETSGRTDFNDLQESIHVEIVEYGKYKGSRTLVVDATTEARHAIEALSKAQALARLKREVAKREDKEDEALVEKLKTRKRELEQQIEALQHKRLRRQREVA